MNTNKLRLLSEYFKRYESLSIEIEQMQRIAMKAADGLDEIEFSIQVVERLPEAKTAEPMPTLRTIDSWIKRLDEKPPTHITTAFHRESGDDVLTLEILGVILSRKHEELKWIERKVQEIYDNEKD